MDVDESGMDERDDYGYGWNERGESFHALKSGRRQGRLNMRDCRRNYSPCNSRMIAALCERKLLAPFTLEGASNRVGFETWLETCLVPVLDPGQIVVVDNATFHRGGRIEQLIRDAGAQLWYLQPYSPDVNKIENCWAWLKSRIRKHLDQFGCLRDAMEHVLRLLS